MPDAVLRRIAYHEAATHTLNKLITIPPDHYSDFQKKVVTKLLKEAFPPTCDVTLQRTSIRKSGYREYWLADGLVVSDLYPSEISDIDEIYPTAFEIITDQIVRRGGNIGSFDNSASKGNLRIVGSEDHPQFAKTLFASLPHINWRRLLDAFKTGDFEETLDTLSQHARTPETGSIIFNGLYGAMQDDEQRALDLHNFFTNPSGQ